ncbi:glycosyltransferase family 2 protein [Streptococcus massiliensis]|uniref:Cell-wall biogenesis glycosyltransferase n=1 Tax=Streptococcus massiliensis TaxID=313439 RepID=A0A380KX89_9STRE|nr:glycosyltransferase [Streptococcus massiliensis]SUN75744.1 cell-wall biogenesis glycosyltransferase [Streptococcus massiliensis]
MTQSLVSIIVPIYNAEKSIEKCVHSILNQSFKDFELILMNDGSTDNTIDKLKHFQETDPRVKLIDKANEGVSTTRNRGIELASGRYIMFIDNDDYIASDYVETFFQAIETEQLDIVLGSYKRVDSQEKVLFQQSLKSNEWSKYIIVAPWAKIYRREFILEHKIQFFNYPIGEDVVFNLKAYSLTDKIKTIDYNGYFWFYNESSISNTSQRGFNKKIDIRVLFEKIISEINPQSKELKYVRYYLKRYYVWYLLFSGRNASRQEFYDQYSSIKKWLADHQQMSSLSPLSYEVSGERFLSKVSMIVFLTVEKLSLVKLFARLYCKGS